MRVEVRPMQARRHRSFVGPLLLVLAGCSSNATGAPDVSVDGQKALGSLTADEAGTLCTELGGYAEGALSSDEEARLGCFAMASLTSVGATDIEAAKSACRASFDSCVAKGEGIPLSFTGSCKSFGDRRGQCAKTVADYQGCFEDIVAATKASLSDPCATARAPGSKPAAPGRCAAVVEACPSLLTGGPTP